MAEFRQPNQHSAETSRSEKRADAQGIDVILVGSFNPAIFHPQWFVRHELIGEEEADPQGVKGTPIVWTIGYAIDCGTRRSPYHARDHVVQKTIDEVALQSCVIPNGFGHVRIRGKLDSNDLEITCFGDALPLERFVQQHCRRKRRKK